MIKKICIKINAENPQMPIMPCKVYEGSAASFEIVGVPGDVGKRRITGIAVVVTNALGITTSHPAIKIGGIWCVTIPADVVGPSGSVGNGIMVCASGTDESDGGVPCWILAAGFLDVLKADGTVAPGDQSISLRAYDARPEKPRKWDIAPNPTSGELERFDGSEWVPFGGGSPSPHASTHGADGTDPVTVAQSQVEGLGEALAGKQDALSGEQLANIDAVPNKADEFGEWMREEHSYDDILKTPQPEFDGGGWIWETTDEDVGMFRSDEPEDSISLTFVSDNLQYLHATRKRVLRTGDAPTEQEVDALIDAKIGNGSVVRHDADGYYVEV